MEEKGELVARRLNGFAMGYHCCGQESSTDCSSWILIKSLSPLLHSLDLPLVLISNALGFRVFSCQSGFVSSPPGYESIKPGLGNLSAEKALCSAPRSMIPSQSSRLSPPVYSTLTTYRISATTHHRKTIPPPPSWPHRPFSLTASPSNPRRPPPSQHLFSPSSSILIAAARPNAISAALMQAAIYPGC